MQRIFRPFNCLILFVFIVPVALFLTAEKSSAQCSITELKIALGAEGQEFQFDGIDEKSGPFTFFATAGETLSATTGPAGTITEAPQHGYQFGGIECDPGGGLVITEVTENGWSEECVDPNLKTFCTITNIRTAAPIPTLSEWGMIAAAAGLIIVGVFFAVKRLRASKQSDAIG